MIQIGFPKWVQGHYLSFDAPDLIPQEVTDRIRKGFAEQNKETPRVSIVVIAYNEEKTILKSLSSLSALKSKYPIEVIVSNNNSTDRTQEILDRCGVKSVFQPLQGVGFARDAGLQIAKGEFHLCADADSIYPPRYVDEMVDLLIQKKAVCVYGRVSFLPDGNKSRMTLAFYEFFKDIAIGLRAIKRPELVAGGASLGFQTEMAKEIGWRTDVNRGEDGQMVLAIKSRGEIRMVKSRASRIWTTARTLDRDGSFVKMVSKRVWKEFSRIGFYFTSYSEKIQERKA
ncbi:glycosyltransferase family 2 protein [soil metagenome]